MTTLNIQNISHKRPVHSKYKPNSYRIFCEDISNETLSDEAKYSSQAPPLFTDPLIIPAQAIEDRNKPHAGRMAGFIRENAHMLNEPVNRIGAKNVTQEQEKRWWEWQVPAETSDWKQKRRSQSSAPKDQHNYESNSNQRNGDFQTTYQKEHAHLSNYVNQGIKSATENDYNIGNKRHSYNPNNRQAVGIVPINDLNTHSNNNEQRVFVDKTSFEHDYDSRKNENYPNRGKRHGAYVVEQVEPKPVLGTRSRPDSNKGLSMWDVMHPHDAPTGNSIPNTQIYKKPTSGNPEELRRQRRDPIGYFEDTKFGGSLGSHLPNSNPGPNFNQNIKANTFEQANNYQPSWNNDTLNIQRYGNQDPNELLDNAMMYQKPVLVGNGYQN